MVIHKGPWQKEEDVILCNQVSRHNGANAWGKIAEALGTRSAKQCRERWHQNLKPGLHNGPITNEEARFITQYVQSRGKRWAEIARQMNGRSDNMIKNWWNGSNNRRQREQCEYRRAPEVVVAAAAQTYPMQLQQPLPAFSSPYPQGYAPVQAPASQSYGAPSSLPASSPVQPPAMHPATEQQLYYSREQPSNLFDRRQDWNMPSLQISPTQNQQQPLPSMSVVTTPSSAGPPTPRYTVMQRASSTECAPLRQYEDDRIDPEIVYASSRRGSEYELAQQQPHHPQHHHQHHSDIIELPHPVKSCHQQQPPHHHYLPHQQSAANKAKMALSNILSQD